MMTAKSDKLLENIVINKNILKPTRKRNENLGRVEDHIQTKSNMAEKQAKKEDPVEGNRSLV